MKVAVTGAAGQIGYSLLPSLLSGSVFGSNVLIDLALLDLPVAMKALGGVVMELEDLAYPCCAGISATDDPQVAFKDADVVVFLGSFPRMAGME